jgi:inner membrane protein involved in colicin E2 resistance
VSRIDKSLSTFSSSVSILSDGVFEVAVFLSAFFAVVEGVVFLAVTLVVVFLFEVWVDDLVDAVVFLLVDDLLIFPDVLGM